MSSEVLQGLAQASLPTSLLATAIGSFLGLVVGMIPGMTISTGIIIILPLTFVMDPGCLAESAPAATRSGIHTRPL